MQFALRDRRTARAEPALLASLLLLGLLSPAGTVVARAQAGGEDPFLAIPWQEGPTTGDLGGIAEVDVPAGYLFTDGNGARQFLELNQNPPSGQEQGLILPVDGEWFVTLDFVPSGYVRDDERDTLDADALFES
ncbi:MAG: hypothetical protein CL484_08115, partial [Acidobacteria bacterium]|nr:hypothetical protein [Acidobacteriota bacterium]